jgi:lysophospholipase L1-like esterase
VTKNIAGPNPGNSEPPQLSYLENPGASSEVRLVTLTIGGNDQKFSTVVTHCVIKHLVDTGLFPTYSVPYVHGLLSWAGLTVLKLPKPCSKASLPTISAMTERLEKVYRKILDLAPKANLIVLGYPSLFDRDAPKINGFNCDLNASDARSIASGEEDFNRLIGRAVEAVNKTPKYLHRVTYIDNTFTFDHHELCRRNLVRRNQPSWINALILPGEMESFHPNIPGHEALSERALLSFSLASIQLGD